MRGAVSSDGKVRAAAGFECLRKKSSCRPVCVDLGHLSPGVLKRDRVGSAAEQLNTKQVKVKFEGESHFCCWCELEFMLPRFRKAGGYRKPNSEYECACLARDAAGSKSEASQDKR